MATVKVGDRLEGVQSGRHYIVDALGGSYAVLRITRPQRPRDDRQAGDTIGELTRALTDREFYKPLPKLAIVRSPAEECEGRIWRLTGALANELSSFCHGKADLLNAPALRWEEPN